jgi:hypothetical protein
MPNINGHALYDNYVLENKVEDILETMLNVRSFMTIDYDLQANAGMTKYIHRYEYEGQVERLAMGAGNTVSGVVTFAEEDYTVLVAQQKFAYYDEQAMKDPMVVDVGLKGAATTMINDMNDQFFDELANANIELKIGAAGALTYDDIVDAISLMQVANNIGGVTAENEDGLFLLIGTDMKADIRKDDDFKRANQGEILFSGQVGTICDIPVVHSRKVPEGVAYLLTREAVTLFVKKETEVEQERDANTRRNDVYLRKVNICALTDATKLVAIKKED